MKSILIFAKSANFRRKYLLSFGFIIKLLCTNLGQELGMGKNENPQVARTEDVNVSGSPFVNSEPIREDQVQNAVKFLSHPKVRGSPVMYRRSFLEKKGLTKEEIDEAFRRVPVRLSFSFCRISSLDF